MKHKVLCWNCKTETEAIEYRCNICKKIQNIGEVNPYDLFSLQKNFLIDYDELEEKYFKLQNIFHPDKFINSANREKEISAFESSSINNAYNMLVNNVDRIKILLNFNGYNIDSNNNKSFTDHLLLEEIMDLQNRCMSIENDNEKLKIKSEIKNKINKIELQINENFKKKKFSEIENLSVKLSYLEKINKNLN
jgi:molecular chaperone HscB